MGEAGDETVLVFIHLPEPLEPEEREARYADPLDAKLRVANLGFVSGGGALQDAPDENGHRAILWGGVDADVYDLDAGRALLRDHLPELGCLAGTRLQFEDAAEHWEDVFNGDEWTLYQPQQRVGE